MDSSEEADDQYIQTLASLTYHLYEQATPLQDSLKGEAILFSDHEVAYLWNHLAELIDYQAYQYAQIEPELCFQTAYTAYYEAKNCLKTKEYKRASTLFTQACTLISNLWEKAIEHEDLLLANFPSGSFQSQCLKNQSNAANADFENNSVIPAKVKKAVRPYVISSDHPMKPKLDDIFFSKRVTLSKKTFKKAGFTTISKGPRSYVHVARHPSLPKYLIKAYMDEELREKYGHPSWYWLVKRCEGAEKIAHIIQKRNIRYFTVASKWIYPLPEHPSPPSNASYTRHYGLLLVTDMGLASNDVNLHAWYNSITEVHLNELYAIISRAKGSSYRPDNIAYTTKRQFAFIDTEYPSQGPDFKSIRKFLNPEMCSYWDYLVKHGGKHPH